MSVMYQECSLQGSPLPEEHVLLTTSKALKNDTLQLCLQTALLTQKQTTDLNLKRSPFLESNYLHDLKFKFLSHVFRASLIAQLVKKPPAMQQTPI